jgi:hypothetical protein
MTDDPFDQIVRAQREEWGDPIRPAVEKAKTSEWTLDKDGVSMKASAVERLDGVKYGLIVARRDEYGQFDDPRNLTREQLQTMHDFIGFVLEDSEG